MHRFPGGHAMQPKTQITSRWKDAATVEQYRTGVSLHSHTSCSEESLKFVHMFVKMLPAAGIVLRRYEHACVKNHGLTLDFERAFWRPPMQPKMAFELEAEQIRGLGLEPLVSITDHDTIEAPMLLRTVPSARHIPVSVEWSAPFGDTEFHLGDSQPAQRRWAGVDAPVCQVHSRGTRSALLRRGVRRTRRGDGRKAAGDGAGAGRDSGCPGGLQSSGVGPARGWRSRSSARGRAVYRRGRRRRFTRWS